MVRTALLATVLTAFFPSDRERAFEPDLSVRIDPCVELMSIVFRFAGNPEYGKARVDSYASDVETWFGDHRDDPVDPTSGWSAAGPTRPTRCSGPG